MYNQYLYIFAALIPFKELFVLKMLGKEKDSEILNMYKYLDTYPKFDLKNLKNIVDKLTELGVYSE